MKRQVGLFMLMSFAFTLQCVSQMNETLLRFHFNFVYGDCAVKLSADSAMHIPQDGTILESCRFYISQIQLVAKDSVLYKEPSSYHLIDAAQVNSTEFSLSIPQNLSFSEVRFNLGIDSLTNTQGALGGNLDPTNGMYWSWQSGYVNFKLEGSALDSLHQMHPFQYHLGGYAFPFNACRVLKYVTSTGDLNFNVDLKEFLNHAQELNVDKVMSPGMNAMRVTDGLFSIFTLE